MEAREPVYKYFKPAWRSFYLNFALMILLIVLAVCAEMFVPYLKEHAWISKLMWIVVAVVDILLFLMIAVKRATMSLILRDNPSKAEDQEIAYIVSHPLRPFSSNFRESIEIGLANIIHIKVGQTMMQTLLNIGDVVITSSGTGHEEIQAKNVPSPQAVRDEIQIHARYYTMPSSTEA
jgi:hypothetical protein